MARIDECLASIAARQREMALSLRGCCVQPFRVSRSSERAVRPRHGGGGGALSLQSPSSPLAPVRSCRAPPWTSLGQRPAVVDRKPSDITSQTECSAPVSLQVPDVKGGQSRSAPVGALWNDRGSPA